MSILSRYIIRLYVLNIAALMVIFASLIVSVDAVINLDRYARRATQLAEDAASENGGVRHILLTALLVLDIWGPRLLQLFASLNGVVLILAMGFTCVQLVRHRELVAVLASGLSMHRVARPFLLTGLCLIGAQAAVQEFAIPSVAHLLPRDPGDAGKRRSESFSVALTPDVQGRLWYARGFDDATGTLQDLHVWERDASGRLQRLITAPSATWSGGAWVLSGGSARAPMNAGTPALGPAVAVERIETSLDPQRIKLRSIEGFAQSLSLRSLASLANTAGVDPRTHVRLERALWGRVSGWLASFIALWGALSLFLVRVPKPLLGPALRAAPIALAGFAAGAVATSASIPGLPVWAGAFVPCLVLVSLTVALATGVDT